MYLITYTCQAKIYFFVQHLMYKKPSNICPIGKWISSKKKFMPIHFLNILNIFYQNFSLFFIVKILNLYLLDNLNIYQIYILIDLMIQ
ncbi:hypothetical protein pb186bvf_014616 [Paramecium bursaria]